MVQKTQIPGIYKVSEGILINKDNDALKAYKARKNKDKEIEELKTEMSKIKNDVSEIKNLLFEILEKK